MRCAKDQRRELPAVLANLIYGTTWETAPLTIDFSKATTGGAREALIEPRWAKAQAEHFGVLEAQSPEFGFFGFAREATQRKYNVAAPAWLASRPVDRERILREAYAVTTGAAAITESLQLERMRAGAKQVRAERT